MDFQKEIGSVLDSVTPGIYIITLFVVIIITLFVIRKLYYKSSLYFEPWLNLSNDKMLDIGLSLAQITFHEMEAIHVVYRKGSTMDGLWKEQSSVPKFLPDTGDLIKKVRG